ncbi:MAG TPA: PhzF family phenazine biosynthesis protein [Terriglobales bacterium]|nr:PhzF family phenazine biosynthesis protein [Terriglobales bacterium]
MELPIYQVDAFTDRAFAGNPAAVMPLDAWLPDDQLQKIAAENNLAETAFFVPKGDEFHIRWFTPTVEVELCGHATLASGYIITRYLQPHRQRMVFDSMSGPLIVTRMDDRLALDFPRLDHKPADHKIDAVAACLSHRPVSVFNSDQYIAYFAVFDDEATVRSITPDMLAMMKLDKDVVVTAPGDTVDFVSRFFAPLHGIPEDPVTGSMHCALTPYWAERLGKTRLHARQVSARGGDLWLELQPERVIISGYGVCVLKGTMTVD